MAKNGSAVRIALLVTLVLLVLALIPNAVAKNSRGPKGTSTIALVQLTARAGGPYFGDQVTFSVSTTATSTPWVGAFCYQNGVQVYNEWHPSYQPNDRNDPGMFVLGPTLSWSGGAASCRADLVKFANGRITTLASTYFNAAA